MKRNDEILKLLEKAGGFVSGAEAGAALGISRAALWKRIHSLRQKGFRIEGSSGRGYRFLRGPGFSAEELRALIKGRLGHEAAFHEEVTSTNETAMRLAAGGARHGTVIAADSQTGGKGRMGRKWASPAGYNIYMSVLLRPSIPPRDASLLALLAAVSTAEALRETTGIEAGIKWPNDILVGGKKTGGILLEMRSELDRVLYAVVGVGINVNMPLRALPATVRTQATSVLSETGKRHARVGIMAAVLDRLSEGVEELEKGNSGDLIGRWRALSTTLEKRVRVKTGTGTFTGRALDIDEEGRLLVRTPGGEVKAVSSGDVEMVRPA